MSALTGEWSVEKIRAVMVHLDRKTGLHGAELPIEMGKAVSYLGRYYCGERKSFYFSTHHLNDPAFRESEAIELIRHEYAHYYVDAAGCGRSFRTEEHTTTACRGSTPARWWARAGGAYSDRICSRN